MFTEIIVSVDQLLLDPNNPRLAEDLNIKERVEDEQLVDEQQQRQLLEQFKTKKGLDDEATTDISDLWSSMQEVGYIPIDRIVVRSILDSDKYLVVEGNRRVSTIKKILNELHSDSPDMTDKEFAAFDGHKESFEKFPCCILETENKTKAEIADNIATVLGLRHHGSLKEWGPLPSSYNIYSQYMKIGGQNKFVWNRSIAKHVEGRLSIKPAKVRSSLKTYTAYTQLKEEFKIKQKHYSLIESAITNNKLTHLFPSDSSSSFLLTDEGMGNMDRICQFSTRDERAAAYNNDTNKPKITKDNIISNPKIFTKLAKIYDTVDKNGDISGLRECAEAYLEDVFSGDSEYTIEDVLYKVIEYKEQGLWVDTLNKLLEKIGDAEEQLSFLDYSATGNELGLREELRKKIKPMLKVMDIE